MTSKTDGSDMTDEDEERRLREDFAQLRAEEDARTPSYRAVLARGVAIEDAGDRGWLVFGLRFGLPALAAAVLVSWLVLPGGPSPERAPSGESWRVGSWRTPSDALLDLSSLPGSSVMGELEVGPLELLPVRDDARQGPVPDRGEERSFG